MERSAFGTRKRCKGSRQQRGVHRNGGTLAPHYPDSTGACLCDAFSAFTCAERIQRNYSALLLRYFVFCNDFQQPLQTHLLAHASIHFVAQAGGEAAVHASSTARNDEHATHVESHFLFTLESVNTCTHKPLVSSKDSSQFWQKKDGRSWFQTQCAQCIGVLDFPGLGMAATATLTSFLPPIH